MNQRSGQTISSEAKKARNFAQQTIYKIIDPVVKNLIKIGVTPNVVTATGLILNIVACVVFIYGAAYGGDNSLAYVGWAGAIILFAGLFDMLDGQVARVGKMSSKYGAMFDSVLDRYSELIVFFGICYYLGFQGYFLSSLFAFIALIGSVMVSYIRARAEGLGIECKGGFMQRPERVVITALGAIGCGGYYAIWGDEKTPIWEGSLLQFEPIFIFVVPIVIIAVFANITAFGRLKHCQKELSKQEHTAK